MIPSIFSACPPQWLLVSHRFLFGKCLGGGWGLSCPMPTPGNWALLSQHPSCRPGMVLVPTKLPPGARSGTNILS